MKEDLKLTSDEIDLIKAVITDARRVINEGSGYGRILIQYQKNRVVMVK